MQHCTFVQYANIQARLELYEFNTTNSNVLTLVVNT